MDRKTRRPVRAAHTTACALLLLLLMGGAGCAISNSLSESSGSISDSLMSPFESSSRSSGGGDSAYRRDVEAYTVAFLDAGAPAAAFALELGDVAARHGVADWRGEAATWSAVGAGLRRAGLEAQAAEAFAATAFPDDPAAVDGVLAGFTS